MNLDKRRRANLLAAVLALTSVAGLALAQQPYFRFNMNGAGGANQSAPPMPKPDPKNDGKLDFGDQTAVVPFTLRALVGEPVSLEFGTIGGTAPVGWLAGPAVPGGLVYSDGVISGVPLAPASSSSEFVAQDADGRQAKARVTFDIYNAAVSLSYFKPVVRVGSPYSGVVNSNVADATYNVMDAPGVTVGATDGQARANLGGIATTPGTFPLSVSVSRPGTSISGSTSRQVTVAHPLSIAFSPSTVPPVSGPLTVTATPRNLVGTGAMVPQGDTSSLQSRGLSYADGVLSGNLSVGPATSLTLRITDSADDSTATASLAIPEIVPVAATIVIGESRPGEPAVAATGSNAPAVVQTDIPDPVCTVTQSVPGITVSQSCVITAGQTVPGSYTLGLSIVPGANPTANPVEVSAPVVINPTLAASSPTPNANPGPGGRVDLVVNTSGIVGTPTFELVGVTPEQLAAAGLAFDPATGGISGDVDPDVSLSPRVKLTDSKDQKSVTVTFTIVTGPATVSTNVSNRGYRVGDVGSYQATSSIPSARFSLVGAPAYVSIDETSGAITIAAPTVTEATPIPGFGVRAEARNRPSVFKQATVASPGTVRPALDLVVAGTASGRGNVVLDVPYSIVGGVSPGQVQSVGGALPQGMTLTSASVTGRPTVPGEYPVTLRVVDGVDGREASRTVAITVTPSLDFTLASATTPVGKGVVGTAMSITATPENAIGTLKFEIFPISGRSTTLPAGLALDMQTGVISGTPAATANGPANVRMTETNGSVVTTIDKALDLSINVPLTAATAFPTATHTTYPNDPNIVSALYDSTAAGTTVSFPTAASITYTFADDVTVNGIQSDLGLSVGVTNVSKGTNFSGSSFAASTGKVWRVVNNGGNASPQYVRLSYNGQAPVAPRVSNTAGSTVLAATNVDFALAHTVADQTGAVTWSATGLPAGLSIDPATGTITGRTTAAYGTYTASVVATDSRQVPSYPKSVPFRVISDSTAANAVPVVTGTADADLVARMLDQDTLEYSSTYASSSRVTLPANGELTFTYARPTTVSGLVVSLVSGNGSFQLVDVDNGNAVIQSGSTSGGFGFVGPFTGTTFVIRNTSGTAVNLAEASPVYNGGHTAFPYVNQTLTAKFGAASNTNWNLDNAVLLDVGTAFQITATSAAAQGTSSWAVTGTLPPGLSLNPSTGLVSGTVTTAGTYEVAFRVTDGRGLASAPKKLRFKVLPTDSAANTMPSSVQAPALASDRAIAALYDNDTYETASAAGAAAGESKVTLAPGAVVTFNYASPIKANYLTVAYASGSPTGALAIRNETTGVALGSPTSTAYFATVDGSNDSVGTSFSVSNASASTLVLATLRPAYNGTTPIVNAIGETMAVLISNNGTSSGNLVNQGNVSRRTTYSTNATVYFRLAQNMDSSTGGSPTTFSLASGSLPPGMALDPASGYIEGKATQTGTFPVTIVATARGYASFPKPVTIKVLAGDTVANTLPSDVQGAGLPGDRAIAALYDGDTYETLGAAQAAAGPSKVSLAPGATITYTYPKVVRANYLTSILAAGSPTGAIEVRDGTGAVVLNGNANGYTTQFFSFATGPDGSEYEGTSFTITNKSASTLVFATLRPSYTGTTPSYPAISETLNVQQSSNGAANGSFNTVNASFNRRTTYSTNAGNYLRFIHNYDSSGSGNIGSPVWSIASGALPDGMALGSTSGYIEGRPTVTGTFTATLQSTWTTSYGQMVTFAKPFTIKVLTQDTVANNAPIDIQGAGLAFDRAFVALYDNDTYETLGASQAAAGPSKVTLAPNATITYTFAKTVRATQFALYLASGSSGGAVEMRNAAGTVIGSGSLAASTGLQYAQFAVGADGSEYESTAFSFTNKSSSTMVFAGLRPAYAGSFTLAPALAETFQYRLSNTSDANGLASVNFAVTARRAAISINTANYIQLYQQFDSQPGGAATYAIASGALPAGVTLSPTSGYIEGRPTETGTFDYSVSATINGVTSFPKPSTLRVLTGDTVATFAPNDIQGAGLAFDRAYAALYDNDSYEASSAGAAAGPSKVTLAPNATVTFVYPRSVRANRIYLAYANGSPGGALEFRNAANAVVGTGTGVVSTSAQQFNLTYGTDGYDYESTSFSVTNKSPSTMVFAALRPTYNGSAPVAPALAEAFSYRLSTNGTPSGLSGVNFASFANRRLTLTFNAATYIQGFTTFDSQPGGAATYAIASGSLPNGVTLSPTSGYFEGKPDADQVGTFTANVTATINGVTSFAKPITLKVMAADTVAEVRPSSVSAPGVADDVAAVALYDNDTYETLGASQAAAGPSKVTLAPGASITYTYPKVVRANRVTIVNASGSPAGSIEMRDDAGTLIGTLAVAANTGTQLFTTTYATQDGYDYQSSSFTLRNASANPMTLAAARPTYNNAAPVSPAIGESHQYRVSTNGTAAGTSGVNYTSGSRRNAFLAPAGRYFDIIPSLDSTPGGANTWEVVSGTLPQGLTLTPSNGYIGGAPTETGDFTVGLRVTIGGIASLVKPLTIRIEGTNTADRSLASVSAVAGATSAIATSALQDSRTDTPSQVTLAAGEGITFTYASPVLVNQLYTYVAGTNRTIRVTNLSTGLVVFSGTPSTAGYNSLTSSTTGYFGPTQTGSQFLVENTSTSPLVLYRMQPAYGSNVMTAPSVTGGQLFVVPRTGNQSITFGVQNSVGTRTWSYSGTLPNGFTFNTSTGAISRIGGSAGAETQVVNVSFVDDLGVPTVPLAVTVTVQ